MSQYSTREAAEKLGLSMATLNRLIAAKTIPLPPLLEVGTVKVRLWSDADIARVRTTLPKIKNGRKSRYSKPQKKQAKKKAKP